MRNDEMTRIERETLVRESRATSGDRLSRSTGNHRNEDGQYDNAIRPLLSYRSELKCREVTGGD